MSAAPALLIDRDGEILVLTLNRPAAANAMDQSMQTALIEALDASEHNAAIRVVLVTAVGERVFSAGADQKEFADRPPLEAGGMRRALLMRTLTRLLDHPKPVVCAVRGKAIGGGWMLALAADEIVASDAASFSLPEIAHGMPTPIGAALLATRVQRALLHRIVQTGAVIDAAQALTLGLVDTVAAVDAFASLALARARTLAALDQAAFAINKRWINRQVRAELESAAVIATQASVAKTSVAKTPRDA